MNSADRPGFRERLLRWLMSPGMTGFTRVAHAFWCLGGFLQYLVLAPLVWFGVCCWNHDLNLIGVGFATFVCSVLSGMLLMVSSKMMTTEAIAARSRGEDLEF